jgi:16S rRNA U1498 N3-methylase RsmE
LPVSLGKRIMRVETAAIYAASIINYIYEGWYYGLYYRIL